MATRILPGKHKMSERQDAPFVGYWMYGDREGDEQFKGLRAAYDKAIEMAGAFNERAAAIKSDKNLSTQGVKAAVLKHGINEALPQMLAARRRSTSDVRRDIAARKARMKPVEIDRSDVVGELQRRELRDHLNAMPADKQAKAIDRADDTMLDAILGCPRALVNLPDSIYNFALERRMKARYGRELEQISDLSDAVEAVERAFDAARDEIRHAAGLTSYEFNQAASEVETAEAEQRPRLKKWGDGTTRVIKQNDAGDFIAAMASDADLASGYYIDGAA